VDEVRLHVDHEMPVAILATGFFRASSCSFAALRFASDSSCNASLPQVHGRINIHIGIEWYHLMPTKK
jgi:hypothetical protein